MVCSTYSYNVVFGTILQKIPAIPNLWPQQLPPKEGDREGGTFRKIDDTFRVYFIKLNFNDFYTFGVQWNASFPNCIFKEYEGKREWFILAKWLAHSGTLLIYFVISISTNLKQLGGRGWELHFTLQN